MNLTVQYNEDTRDFEVLYNSGVNMSNNGWIEWQGGECPVDGDLIVEYRRGHDTRVVVDWAANFMWSKPARYRVLPTFADIVEKDAEIERLRADEQECAALRQRMSDILNRTANALRGEPPPLALHGWSDLPERVDRLRAELAVAREAMQEALEALQTVENEGETSFPATVSCAITTLAAYLREQADRQERGAVAYVPTWAIDRLTGKLGAVADPVAWGVDAPLYVTQLADCTPVYLHPAPQSVPADLLEAVDRILEEAPCECSDKRRYELGEHLSHCCLFDLNAARFAASPAASVEVGKPVSMDVIEQRLLTWRQRFVNWNGDRLALDDFMDQQSIDDLIDFVCEEYVAPAAPAPDERCPECNGFGSSLSIEGGGEECNVCDGNGSAPDAVEALRELVDEIDGLVSESAGVYGLHLNGDESPWDELLPGGRFERLASLETARAALAAADQKEPKCD